MKTLKMALLVGATLIALAGCADIGDLFGDIAVRNLNNSGRYCATRLDAAGQPDYIEFNNCLRAAKARR